MDMVRQSDVLVRQRREVGVETCPPVSVPVRASVVKFIVDRLSWPVKIDPDNPDVVEIMIQFSGDGGVAWRDLGGCGTTGGDILDNGVLQRETYTKTKIPSPGTRGRLVRGRLRTRLACETACHLEFEG